MATEGRRGSVGKQHSEGVTRKNIGDRLPTLPWSFLLSQKKPTPSTKGEFISSAFIFLSQKVVLGYSPSAEGVATEGRRGSVGNTL